MKMINTNECEHCQYGTVDDNDKAKVTVYCSLKEKRYLYGQCVPCDSLKKKRGKSNETI